MYRKTFFNNGKRGSTPFKPFMLAFALISLFLLSASLGVSSSMWSERLKINVNVKTGYFNAKTCDYKIAFMHSQECGCGCLCHSQDILHTVLEDGNKTIYYLKNREEVYKYIKNRKI